jgi:iron(III) transport system substrate-binding protein
MTKRRLALGMLIGGALVGAALPPTPAAAYPDYYPADYAKLVEASRAEKGILIYGNIGEVNWRPILAAFNKEYPWIQVRFLDLGANEVFERYYAEQAAASSAVDLVLSQGAASWLEFIAKGNVVPYESPEIGKLPSWTIPSPGVYTISLDPIVIAYNKVLLTPAEHPKSLADLVALVRADPKRFDKRIASFRPMGTAGSQANYLNYMRHVGEEKALDYFSVIGPLSNLYRSSGPIYEKITTGEYLAGYFLSPIPLFPLLADPNRAAIIGWAFPADGTIVAMRNFAIARTGQSPNSTRALLPYRDDADVGTNPLRFTLKKVIAQVGEQNVIPTSLDASRSVATPEMIAKVTGAFKLKD